MTHPARNDMFVHLPCRDFPFRNAFQCFSVFFVVFTVGSIRLMFSVSLPGIWQSCSTSKIDALDGDETPLRLTTSQTATEGALDTAPTLHFLELGLKTSGEE